jgi:hypothetical protein
MRVPALLALLLAAAPALADEAPPPPEHCPAGQTPQSDSDGPYCEPTPPASCPARQTPRVYRDRAYCEPPAPAPCPPGSAWTSRSATETWCQGGDTCDSDANCDGTRCVGSSLCVRTVDEGKWTLEIASGLCPASGACPTGESCVTARRCQAVAPPIAAGTPPAKRKGGCSVGALGGLSGALSLLGIGLLLLRRRGR